MKVLTEENYYEDKEYLSVSRFKKYVECEAKAKAIDENDWQEGDNKALLVGNYVHSYFESKEAHEKFLEENKKSLFSSRKPYGLLKDFQIADKVIKTLEEDTLFNNIYHGRPNDDVIKEEIVTGGIDGVPFKGKLDSVNRTLKYMVDLKTMKSLQTPTWSESTRSKVPQVVENIHAFGYKIQAAVYQELFRQNYGETLRTIIAAVSKEEFPDKELIELTASDLEEGMSYLKANLKRVWDVIQGKEEPVFCEKCDYCKSKKKLNKITTIPEIMNKFHNN